MTTTYPQYRKYRNNQAYFKILSGTEWEEIRVMGTRYILHTFSVKIMPDRNYLHDMTFDYEQNWLKIEEAEYENLREKLKPK
ncbi:MAG TPA: hypothetical protein VF868_07440 [Bacteroidia bacterium]|jgi:hypothetical protein